MDATHANAELFAALGLAQCEVENAVKSSTNPHFKSKYADLAEVLGTARPIYAKHGVSLVQSAGKLVDGQVVVQSVLAHKSGGYITTEASCIPGKTDAQGIGAATTYLRRFSAAALYCIAQEDDDGNAASGRTDQSAPTPKAKPAPVKKPADKPEAWAPPEPLEADADACKSKADWNKLYNRFAPYAAGLDEQAKQAAWKWLVGKAKASGYRWDKDGALFEPMVERPDFLA